MISAQIELQGKSDSEIAEAVKADNPDSEGSFTTVGFEHEFATIREDQINPLHELTHVELAKSDERLGFTDLPFKWETDSNNTLELVGAPLIVPTPKDLPIPDSDDVKTADYLSKEALAVIGAGSPSLEDMIDRFQTNMGLTFTPNNDIKISSLNYNPGAEQRGAAYTLGAEDIKGLKIDFGSKGKATAATQINFATNAFIYDTANDVVPRRQAPSSKEYQEKQTKYWGIIQGVMKGDATPNETIFLKELAKNLSQITAVTYQKDFNEIKKLLFTSIEDTVEYKETDPNIKGLDLIERKRRREAFDKLKRRYTEAEGKFNTLRSKSGWVKDANTFWLKDTLFNFGLGILNKHEWITVSYVCHEMLKNTDLAECADTLGLLIEKIDSLLSKKDAPIPEKPRLDFGEHDPQFLGARQDTFISLAGDKRPPRFQDETLHLIEMRDAEGVKEKLDAIKTASLVRQQEIKEKAEVLEAQEISPLSLSVKKDDTDYIIFLNPEKDKMLISVRKSGFGNLRMKTTELPLSVLADSNITCEKDSESGLFTVTIESRELKFNMAVEEGQTVQFLRFVRKVLKPHNFRRALK